MGRDFFGGVFLSKKRFLLPSFLAMLCALLTGCPHNDYTVELKPKGSVVERTLVFYRADGGNSNGVPNYQAFPSNELTMISRAYPVGAVKPDGERHVATGEFAGPLPKDGGGAGAYTNFATSLGDAGFYSERFRGNDDLAAQTAKGFQAADQITDLVIGWTRTEFGRERGYKKLRKFLDEDFRRDLKNAGLYLWVEQVSALSDTNAPQEFAVRFGQYLLERGYLKPSDAPQVYLAAGDSGDGFTMLNLVQRLVTDKLGISASDPPPKSFAVLKNPAALEKSWTNYLARSDLYQAKVKEWEKKRKSDPKLEAPKPLDVPGDLFKKLLEPLDTSGGGVDHLTVKLALDHAPNHSNGKWHDGQVVWAADLDENRPLPVLCYASWSHPDVEFQTAHFGNVILDGDELSEYCLWQSSLDGKHAQEWKSFLADLQPGENIRGKLEAFQFTAESVPAATNQVNIGRKMLLDALPKAAKASPTGSK